MAPQYYTLDVMVTGVGNDRRRVTAAEEAVARAFSNSNAFSSVNVIYYRQTQEVIDESGVSEFDWLLYNAASARYICHVTCESLLDNGTIDTDSDGESTFAADIAACLDLFTPPPPDDDDDTNNNLQPLLPSRIRIDPVPPISGVECLYYATHWSERCLRSMTDTFYRPPRLALLVPMTLKGVANPAQPIPLISTLFPSLKSTLSHSHIVRGLYLGYDDDDESVTSRSLEQIRQRVERQHRVPIERIIKFPSEWRLTDKHPRASIKMYNALFRVAMMDGYDLAVQLQDDARLETPGWDRTLGAFVCKNVSGVGAYGMSDRYQPTLMRNMLVSRTHFDIFGYFIAEDAVDITRWVARVLESYTNIVRRVKVTNTIRDTRRRTNQTLVIGRAEESEEELAIIARDRRYFLDTIAYLDDGKRK